MLYSMSLELSIKSESGVQNDVIKRIDPYSGRKRDFDAYFLKMYILYSFLQSFIHILKANKFILN